MRKILFVSIFIFFNCVAESEMILDRYMRWCQEIEIDEDDAVEPSVRVDKFFTKRNTKAIHLIIGIAHTKKRKKLYKKLLTPVPISRMLIKEKKV